MAASISVDFLSHTFRGNDAPTLAEVSLFVQAGEQIALIGRSGCGKSTLLHMLAGLSTPSDGCVRINGHTVTHPSPKWNMMFQKPSLYPWMTVRENAALGTVFTRRRDPERIEALLDLVGLTEKADVNVQQLSGGQQQRVALARSLATEPDVLLLDEPFSALDAFTRTALQSEVAQISQQQGLTTVIVTHDIDEAVAMATRVLVMDANPGRVVGEFAVDMPYPRDRGTSEFFSAREALMRRFDELVNEPLDEPTADNSPPQGEAGRRAA